MNAPAHTPVESRVRANGIDHHVLTWNDDGADTIVLCHGFLDLAWSYNALAPLLAAAGYRVVAFDWRGHGESSWIGPGGYYHFADYILDLEELLPQIVRGKLHLLGHSMGGTAVALYAGTRPKAMASLILVEGLGPPAHDVVNTPDRFDAFLRTVHKIREANPKPLASIDEAVTRLRAQNPELSDDLGRFIATKSTHTVADGALHWRFDPLHRTSSPMPFQLAAFGAFLSRIAAPTLYVCGEQGFRLPDEGARLAQIKQLTFREYPAMGHMIHWFATEALAADITTFLATA